MTIAFVGGGTMGPVTPLIAVYDALKATHPEVEALWFGTPNGPEREVVLEHGIPFVSIPVARLPRYWSSEWLTFPWRYWLGLRKARRVVRQETVQAVVSAGGFTAVPVIRAAARLGIPCITHQLDCLPSLTNRFVVDRCERVTTSFTYAKPPFGTKVETVQIPTPTRMRLEALPARSQALRELGLSVREPTILVMGGGTGALAINQMVQERVQGWRKRGWQVILIAGKGKLVPDVQGPGIIQREFFSAEEMRVAYAAADVVVCRAGMGTLSEAVALRKPLILVPIPENHQELNARAFTEVEAAIVLDQRDLEFGAWVEKAIHRYLRDPAFTRLTVDRMQRVIEVDNGEALAEVVWDVVRRRQMMV